MIGRARNLVRRVRAALALPARTAEEHRALMIRLDGIERTQATIGAKLDNILGHVQTAARESRLGLGQLALPAADRRGTWSPVPSTLPPGVVFDRSLACQQAMFETPYFAYWTKALNFTPRYHRKLWEFVFICQALSERGLLDPGRRGLGFGVGSEPLTALFAAHGCAITATDMAAEEAARAGWTDTQQYAAGKSALFLPWLCDKARFDAAVEFQVVDMNHVPDDLTGYDFCWSACALEHLGSIDLSLAFIERSVACLKPGGYAVHTTELNVGSNDATLDQGGTVLLRRRDFEALAQRLTSAGHKVAPLDFSTGDQPLDRYIDMPPYLDDPHLKLALEGYSATSFGLIVQRGR